MSILNPRRRKLKKRDPRPMRIRRGEIAEDGKTIIFYYDYGDEVKTSDVKKSSTGSGFDNRLYILGYI